MPWTNLSCNIPNIIFAKFGYNHISSFGEEVASVYGRTDGLTTHHPVGSPELHSRWAKKENLKKLRQQNLIFKKLLCKQWINIVSHMCNLLDLIIDELMHNHHHPLDPPITHFGKSKSEEVAHSYVTCFTQCRTSLQENKGSNLGSWCGIHSCEVAGRQKPAACLECRMSPVGKPMTAQLSRHFLSSGTRKMSNKLQSWESTNARCKTIVWSCCGTIGLFYEELSKKLYERDISKTS